MPCLGINRFWASPFPISFHDYKAPGINIIRHLISRGTQKGPQFSHADSTVKELRMQALRWRFSDGAFLFKAC